MTDVRTLRRGEAVALSSLSRSRRSPDELVVAVRADGPPVDVVALALGPDGRVGSDRDLVFFNQPSGMGGALTVEPATGRAHIRTGGLEDRVARVLVACAGDALTGRWPTTLQVDVVHPSGTLLATAVVDVPAAHRAETLLEVYRWGAGWRLRLLGEGYAAGLEGLVRDHGVQVDDGPAAPTPTPAPVPPAPPVISPPPVTSPPVTSPPATSPLATPPVAAWTPPAAVAPVPPQPTPRPARKPRRRTGLLLGAGAAALVVVVGAAALAGGSDRTTPAAAPVAASTTASSDTPTVSSSPTVAVAPLAAASAAVVPDAAAAQAALALLPVKGRAPMTGYDRAAFGQTWADVDRNGCDTRNDVLRRDVVNAVIDPSTRGCVVLSGDVVDPYSGRTLAFVRGASSATVQIDHVVALGDAWQTGAQALDATRREQFANDPANLVAVDGALNAQKGDGDAATWLPPAVGYRCTYVARQVAVKQAYGLWVTASERDAIAGVLAGCPGATPPPATTSAPPAPATTVPPPAAPVTTAAPADPPPAADPGGAYYENCAAARAAGAAPILRGEPGYRPGLDRDGDGIACET